MLPLSQGCALGKQLTTPFQWSREWPPVHMRSLNGAEAPLRRFPLAQEALTKTGIGRGNHRRPGNTPPKSHPDNEQTAASHAANIHRNLHINRITSDRSDSKGRRPGIPLIGKPPTRSRDGLTTGKRAEFRARHGRMAPDYAADSSMSANGATESEWRNRIRRGRTGRTGGRTTSRTISLERHACTPTEPTPNRRGGTGSGVRAPRRPIHRPRRVPGLALAFHAPTGMPPALRRCRPPDSTQRRDLAGAHSSPGNTITTPALQY